jgi:hypothetical protein
MRTYAEEGVDQRMAGVALILKSHLLLWHPTRQRFIATTETAFESYWPSVDKEFGRLMCWIMFSAGAEFVGKGVCLWNSIEVRRFFGNGNFDFGKMNTLIGKFPDLFEKKNATDEQKAIVLRGYKVLNNSIRNRDAHGYHRGQRQKKSLLWNHIFSEHSMLYSIGARIPRSSEVLVKTGTVGRMIDFGGWRFRAISFGLRGLLAPRAQKTTHRHRTFQQAVAQSATFNTGSADAV